MTMLTAYFYESGTQAGSPAVVVAGYLAPNDQSRRFETEWQDILADAGIQLFHMSQYESRHGPYKDWDDPKRKRVLERLIVATRNWTVIPVGAAVALVEFHNAFSTSPELSPYAFCMLQCFARIGEWADTYKLSEPIAYVVESGAGFNRDLDMLKQTLSGTEARKARYRFEALTVADKKNVTPLQAADMLAYEMYKEMVNFIVPGKEIKQLRWSAIRALDGKPTDYCGYYTAENLRMPLPDSWQAL